MTTLNALSTSILNPSFTTFFLLAAGSLLTGFLYLASRPPVPSTSPPPTSSDWPIVGDIRFFTKRWNFFQDATSSSGSGNFSFHVGKHHVIGLSGKKVRQTFFENRQLNFTDGYAILFGQAPSVDKVDDGEGNLVDTFTAHFSKRITSLLKREVLNASLPSLISDCRALLDSLAASPSQTTNPFDSVYTLVYQLTMRTVGVSDIADDPALLVKTLELYHTFEGSSTPTSIIFPWLPTPAKIKRTIAMGRLYVILKSFVDDRKTTGKRKDDPLQFQIDQGDDMKYIIQFMVGALFAGLLNTGINAAAILCYLAADPALKARVLEEITAVADAHSPDGTKSASLLDRVSALPLEVWEREFPVLDACLKESIRLQMPGSAFRRNTSGKEIVIDGGERIPDGAFVTYHVRDMHQDPTAFPSPTQYDPTRFLSPRAEDKKAPYTYMGWGLGRHPCLGMKFAKLETNLILTLFLSKFDFDLVNARGKPMEMPAQDPNAWAAEKPRVGVFLRLRVRE